MHDERVSAEGSGALGALATLIEGWKLVVLIAGGLTIVAVGVATLRGQRFEASVTLSSVMSPRSLPSGGLGAGLAAQFLNLSGGTGMQATPALIARLGRLQTVLLAVAMHRPDSTALTIVERLTKQPGASLPSTKILRTMHRVILPSLDRETGLVTIRVVHRDSALARAISERTVAEISRAFREASRAQASELRRAQQARLDSAENQLRHAEAGLVDFLAANRVIAPHSALQARLQSHQRAVNIAETVYMQVRTERESAVGKELEETPAVVVLDGLPAHLPRVSVSRTRVGAFAFFLGLALASAILLLLERSREQLTSDPASRGRLLRAVATLPLVGRAARRDAAS